MIGQRRRHLRSNLYETTSFHYFSSFKHCNPLLIQCHGLSWPAGTYPWLGANNSTPTTSSWSSRLLNRSFEDVHQPMYLILIPNSPSIELARIASRHAFWSSTVAGTKSAGISPSNPNRRGIQTNINKTDCIPCQTVYYFCGLHKILHVTSHKVF